MRKPANELCDQVRLKAACSATAASKGLGVWGIKTIGVILSYQGKTKTLIRQHGCDLTQQADLHLCCLLMAFNMFSNNVAQIAEINLILC